MWVDSRTRTVAAAGHVQWLQQNPERGGRGRCHREAASQLEPPPCCVGYRGGARNAVAATVAASAVATETRHLKSQQCVLQREREREREREGQRVSRSARDEAVKSCSRMEGGAPEMRQ